MYILCLKVRTAVTSTHILEKYACCRACNVCDFPCVKKCLKRLFGDSHIKNVFCNIYLRSDYEVTVVINMRQVQCCCYVMYTFVVFSFMIYVHTSIIMYCIIWFLYCVLCQCVEYIALYTLMIWWWWWWWW